ncbi:Methyltransferase domain-containing protein [Anaerovirgula multivorans]|uniref:Methyltransferase domain-containing protein n=1 Tax=Anaerovirgula multivorans TaxID=312168 RepID=A0A239IT17_9FIRM|nr:class I SAM-dependent methyltransferase [Anaerovirgula multivorans]SNS96348.1 Methyltransferase domain-containing protein [Anaerovirgula multivorans]
MSRREIWDFWAKGYEGLWVQKYSLAPTRREILLYLEKHLEKDKKYRILDVGCGIGQLLREIKSRFQTYELELSGIDFSKEMIQRAEVMGDGISYQQMDVKDIEDLQGPFDIIICTHSFPYYKGQAFVLHQFRRVMKDDGYLLLAQASQNNLYDHVMMFFVKFTTGKARYPSVKAVEKMVEKLFQCKHIIKIKERFFMPSIYFFVLKGDKT